MHQFQNKQTRTGGVAYFRIIVMFQSLGFGTTVKRTALLVAAAPEKVRILLIDLLSIVQLWVSKQINLLLLTIKAEPPPSICY